MSETLLARWPGPCPSAGTKSAEEGLGILGAPHYFYVMRAHETFGLVVFLFEEVKVDESIPHNAMGATPFDTGGLWLGKIDPFKGRGTTEQLCLFKREEVPLSRWSSSFDDYMSANFASPQDYVRGEPPGHSVRGITNQSPPNDVRAWTWEVRYPSRLVPIRLRLERAYVHPDDYEGYLDWLPESDYEDGEMDEIMQVIGTKVHVHDGTRMASHEAEAALLKEV